MSFWESQQLAEQYGENLALIDSQANSNITYLQLHEKVQQAKVKIVDATPKPIKQLIVIEAAINVNTIIFYLAALQLKHTLWLVDATLDKERKDRERMRK